MDGFDSKIEEINRSRGPDVSGIGDDVEVGK